MKKIIFFILLSIVSIKSHALIWYASPTGSGSGTFSDPFNLQTALTNNSNTILPGDILYLRGGVYNSSASRFNSALTGAASKYITVASYPGEWAILNGNITPSTNTSITATLRVNGSYVIYKDFEITYENLITRYDLDPNYAYCGGIEHYDGINCKFINLVLHDNPGTGFWSGKTTGATEVYGCVIYNNGWYSNGTYPEGSLNRGRGPGIYAQNQTDTNRIFKNNIVFNNFYNGFEVWSASTDQPQIVKNFILDNNTSFNNGSPYASSAADKGSNNILVATMDNQTNGNFPTNIYLTNNELYHNTDFTDVNLNGEARPLKIGHPNSETHDVIIDNNFICGRNPGLEINTSYNLTFTNNTVLTKYVYLSKTLLDLNLVNPANFHFDNNKYFTRFSYNGFRFVNGGAIYQDHTLNSWKTTFGIDLNSTQHLWNLNLNSPATNPVVSKVTRNEYNKNLYKVVLFNYSNPNVSIDFSSYGIPVGTNYTIRDIENYPAINTSGSYSGTPIIFNLNLTSPAFTSPTGSYPTTNGTSYRTPGNFGVFLIEFQPYCAANDKVLTTSLQTDGKIIIGGEFTKYNETGANHIARLNTNMKLDNTFVTGSGTDESIKSSVIDSNGKIILGGKFTKYNGITKNRIVRLNSDGSIDNTFLIGTGANDEIVTIAKQTDGKLLIGGSFTSFNSITKINIARLNPDGSLDTTFNSNFNINTTYITTIEVQPDGKILIGGYFPSYGSNSVSNIVRLNSDGTIDPTFITGIGFDNQVECIKVQSDGKILVGGNFSNYNGNNKKYLARLENNGNFDTSFTNTISILGGGSGVKAIQIQNDNKIIIGGGFNVINNVSRRKIARINTDGTLDTTFDPGDGFGPQEGRLSLGSWVKTISIQTDGKIICGGFFNAYNNNPFNNIVRLNTAITGGVSRSERTEEKQILDVTEKTNLKIQIYPNPFNNSFKISSNVDHTFDFIEVYNSYGKLILAKKINTKETEIQIDTFESGILYYKIFKRNSLITQGRLMKN